MVSNGAYGWEWGLGDWERPSFMRVAVIRRYYNGWAVIVCIGPVRLMVDWY